MASERWLIVGLGNPGPQYEETRHNIGFMVIHRLSEKWHISAKSESKFKALMGTGQIIASSGIIHNTPSQTHPVILAQPLTYMNLSGESVIRLVQYYDIDLSRLLVIYDDAALPFGKLRLRRDGSAGGQNGMKSIIQCLGGNEDFPRLRLGIGMPDGQRDLTAHVLSRFAPQEKDRLDKVLAVAADAVQEIIILGFDQAMSRYNGFSIL